MAKVRKATFADAIKIGDLVREHFDVEVGQYKGDLDDRAIAKMVGEEIGPNSVGEVRRQLGLEIKNPRRVTDLESANAKIAELDAKLMGFRSALSNMEQKVLEVHNDNQQMKRQVYMLWYVIELICGNQRIQYKPLLKTADNKYQNGQTMAWPPPIK